ncbi:hypothetical protein [Stenotrophomonas tumulicola]|uniref:Transmembrane protein n=1 Tax=Stenotrophomonas tumulicola TaxID=1685415 RepID=A0A7W3FN08_9GAMM|nr:hypothetical protein [Stenotrophomonas tumulicola]MBA8682425.1 hypothetical protein [Stenotrophomonas tumulicola]
MPTLALSRPPFSPPAVQRLLAWLVVIAVHALIGWWLMSTTRAGSQRTDEYRTSLRWLAPAPVPVSMAAATSRQQRAMPPPARQGAPVTQMPAATGPTADAIVETPPAPLDLGLRAGAVRGGDGIDATTLAPKLIGRRDLHPAFQAKPRYFRMRPQMSPQQVLQGVAQFLGLWPPGYAVDPCALGRQDMQYFQGAVDDMDRQALHDAIHQASAHCR